MKKRRNTAPGFEALNPIFKIIISFHINYLSEELLSSCPKEDKAAHLRPCLQIQNFRSLIDRSCGQGLIVLIKADNG